MQRLNIQCHKEHNMSRELEYVDPNNLVIIGLDTEDDESHPLFDERVFLSVNEALVRNIMTYGIQHPVIVRRAGTQYLVIDGRQRVRAAREAAKLQEAAGEYKVQVPVREAAGTDSRVVGIMVSTNEQRLDDSILTKAAKAARLLDLTGDIEQVGIAFGRKPKTIEMWISLLNTDPRVQTALRENKLSTSAALELAKLPREQQVEVLEEVLNKAEDKPITAAKTKKAAYDAGATDTNPVSAQAVASHADSSGQRAQVGIKRTWLRKALKTDAAANLTDEQRGVLEWFATGNADAGTWFDDFQWEAEREMNGE
jgi:ParB family chromosome partitioning protein